MRNCQNVEFDELLEKHPGFAAYAIAGREEPRSSRILGVAIVVAVGAAAIAMMGGVAFFSLRFALAQAWCF